MKCRRCDGEQQVITYRGRPLWCGPTRGLEVVRAIRRGEHEHELSRFPLDGLRLLWATKAEPEAFRPTICPDCQGTGVEPDEPTWRVVQPGGDDVTGGVA